MAQNDRAEELCRPRLKDKSSLQNGQTAQHETLWVSWNTWDPSQSPWARACVRPASFGPYAMLSWPVNLARMSKQYLIGVLQVFLNICRYLYGVGKSVWKKWKKRYYVLVQVSQYTFALCTYKEKKTEPAEMMQLDGYTVDYIEPASGKRFRCFFTIN